MAKVEIKKGSPKSSPLKLIIYVLATYVFATVAIDRGLVWYFPLFIFLGLTLREVWRFSHKK